MIDFKTWQFGQGYRDGYEGVEIPFGLDPNHSFLMGWLHGNKDRVCKLAAQACLFEAYVDDFFAFAAVAKTS